MRFASILLCILLLTSCQKPKLYYDVKAREGAFPYPTELPVFDPKRGPEEFDWRVYVDASSSKADQAFRENIAFLNGASMFGVVGNSTMEEMNRFQLAASEYREKCTKLANLYRGQLKDDPDTLRLLDNYLKHRDAGVEVEVKLIGGSQGGAGGGTRAASAKSRFFAMLSYYQSLEHLGSSFHFQDIPGVEGEFFPN